MAKPQTPESQTSQADGIRCDFCGEHAPSVRRIALDRDYERLLTPHKERYACAKCSAAKDAARRGLTR
jgi:DNA-directed RNA polymerase subunit RPC12/RpoP